MVKLHELPSTKVSNGKRISPPPPKLIEYTNEKIAISKKILINVKINPKGLMLNV